MSIAGIFIRQIVVRNREKSMNQESEDKQYYIGVKRLFWVVLSLFISFATARADKWWNYEALSTDGTEFWLTLMRNGGTGESDGVLELTLIVASHVSTVNTITVSNPNITWSRTKTIAANSTDTICIPTAASVYMETSDCVENKGLLIESTGIISLYAANSGSSSYDASIVLPSKLTTYEYIVQTYSPDEDASEFAIVATQNNTTVYITPSDTTAAAVAANTSGISHYPGITFPVTLNRGQSYQLRTYHTNGDLSGSYICSDKPIAMFNGNQSYP